MTNLLSDVGGALGLCLGLCIWQMVHSVMQAVVMVVNKAENLANKTAFKKSKSLAKKKIGRQRKHFTTPSIRRQPLKSVMLSRDQSNNSLICENPIGDVMSPMMVKDGLKVNNNQKTLYLFSVWCFFNKFIRNACLRPNKLLFKFHLNLNNRTYFSSFGRSIFMKPKKTYLNPKKDILNSYYSYIFNKYWCPHKLFSTCGVQKPLLLVSSS